MNPDRRQRPTGVGIPAPLLQRLDEWVADHNAAEPDPDLHHSRSSAIRQAIRAMIDPDKGE